VGREVYALFPRPVAGSSRHLAERVLDLRIGSKILLAISP
jgi:hypothetical protein